MNKLQKKKKIENLAWESIAYKASSDGQKRDDDFNKAFK